MNTSLKSVSDLSAILGCQKITVYRLVRQGKIPHRRIGALLRFSDSDINNYLESVKSEKSEGKNENTL
jgi:excisionase family DNA binding protein